MKNKQIIFLGFLNLVSLSAKAEMLSFAEVWNKIATSSPALEGAKLKVESVDQAMSRSEKHWLPKVYLDARSYKTNDPGSAFFGILSQRKVENSDFAADSLNHPDSPTFTRGALGVDLALYEGGMKEAQVDMFRLSSAAEKMSLSQMTVEQYAHSGLAYASIATVIRQKAKLKDLAEEIEKLMKVYQLGQKTNPVGYSGLLGMKSLFNRVSGLIEQLEAIEKSYYAALKEMGVENKNWSPHLTEALSFVDKFLSAQSADSELQSFKIQAQKKYAQAGIQAAEMEKARYLPRVGAFAETYSFNGKRDTATGYSAGLYLQWNLFDPADIGKYNQASLASRAAEKFSQASLQQENAERESLLESDKSLRSNLARIQDSDKLLSEQTRVAANLFKNGSINALQFVEILNRRTDLIYQQSELELALIKAASERIQKSQFQIPNFAVNGGQ